MINRDMGEQVIGTIKNKNILNTGASHSSGGLSPLHTHNINELIKSFSRHFEIVSATTEEEIRQSWKLRYQVYSVENHFENPDDNPDQLERDEYDAHSAHSLLIHRATGLVVGTVRLILPNPASVDALFPIEAHCGTSFNGEAFNRATLPRRSLAEISRFAISKEFKRRIPDKSNVFGSPDINQGLQQEMADLERRLIPHITVGLFAAIVRMSAMHGITHWYAVMEPALLRLLKQFSINFQPVGSAVNYHGKRYPCVATARDVLAQMEVGCPEIWRLITDEGRIWPSAHSQAA